LKKFLFIPFFFLLICIISPVVSQNTTTSNLPTTEKEKTADYHYQRANKLYLKDQFKMALEEIKKSLDIDKSSGKAFNLKALILLEYDGEYDWIEARKAAEKALEIDPQNPDYIFTFASIREKQGWRAEAMRNYKKVLKYDPENAEAYYHLGILYRNEKYFYNGMVDVESMTQLYDENYLRYIREFGNRSRGLSSDRRIYDAQTTLPESFLISSIYADVISEKYALLGVISFEEYAKEALENSESFFNQALEYNPNHWQSLIQLGLLAYEYHQSEKLAEYVRKLETMGLYEKEVWLFLGLAHLELHHPEKAEDAFRMAVGFLSDDEKRIFETPLYLLPFEDPDEQDKSKAIQLASNIDKEAYWKSRDPFFSTMNNERKLEHLARCAYSHFRFSFPLRRVEGLKTHRGKVYIRYGSPLHVARKFPDVPFHYYEIWYYKDKTFWFDDPWGDGRSGYQLAKNNLMREAARYEFKDHPETYTYEAEGKSYDIPCQMVSFRGDQGKTALDIFYGVPVFQSDFISFQNVNLASYQNNLFFFDRNWNTILNTTSSRNFKTSILLDSTETNLYVDQTSIEIDPGDYFFSLEMQNQYSKNVGTFRDSLEIVDYLGDSLQMSDILLAQNIKTNEQPITDRQALEIVPNPTKSFEIGQQLYLFYEIYNLVKNSEMGKTNYNISTTVTLKEKPKKGIGKVFKGIKSVMGLKSQNQKVTSYYDYQGDSETERQYSIIDIKDWGFGTFVLSVNIQDVNSDQVVRKEVEFKIREFEY
jgi:GWxTD domain-containing protein